MDEASERIYQEALHPARWTERIYLEPDDHDPGSQGLCFQSRSSTTVVRLTGLDLDELEALLAARRMTDVREKLGRRREEHPDEAVDIDRVLAMLEEG